MPAVLRASLPGSRGQGAGYARVTRNRASGQAGCAAGPGRCPRAPPLGKVTSVCKYARKGFTPSGDKTARGPPTAPTRSGRAVAHGLGSSEGPHVQRANRAWGSAWGGHDGLVASTSTSWRRLGSRASEGQSPPEGTAGSTASARTWARARGRGSRNPRTACVPAGLSAAAAELGRTRRPPQCRRGHHHDPSPPLASVSSVLRRKPR